MAIEIERQGRRCRIALGGELSIRRVAELKPQLVESIADCDEAEIDLAGVDEIDTAGLQLLLLARREAVSRGSALQLVNHSHAVADLLELCDLNGYFCGTHGRV